MKKRTSVYFARLFALLALIAALVAVYLVASNALDEDATKSGKQDSTQQAEKPKPKIKTANYVVQSGDTLTRISYQSGVKVTRLIELNPEVDPQNLVIGQIIKLR